MKIYNDTVECAIFEGRFFPLIVILVYSFWRYFVVHKLIKGFQEKNLKKLYEKCKPGMLKKFGRILSYEEFVQHLAYAHEKGMDK